MSDQVTFHLQLAACNTAVSTDFEMAKLCFLAVVALCSFVLAFCEPVKYKDCGSKESTLAEVDVIPCPTQPCQLRRGTNATVEVKFTPKEIVSKATTVVYGKLGPVKVPFNVHNPDACSGQGLTCPLKPGVQYTFKTTLEVKESYPALEVIVIWELTDQGSNMVYCFQLPVKLV